MNDWGAVKARLVERAENLGQFCACDADYAHTSGYNIPRCNPCEEVADIRAALEEVLFLRGEVSVRDEALEVLRQRVEELEQTTGDLCDSCGWRTVLAGKCARCAQDAAEAKLERVVATLERARAKASGWTPSCVAALAAAKGE